MRNDLILALTVVAALAAAPAAVASKPSLQQVDDIENGLLAVAVADKIRRECGAISGRFFEARRVLNRLYRIASANGYSDIEVETYVASHTQRDRMRVKRDAYLAGQGVVKSDPSSYCAAGRAEIDKSSQIGALLRAR